MERGGTIGTYSSGAKMTLKVGLTPMETTTFTYGVQIFLQFITVQDYLVSFFLVKLADSIFLRLQ